MIRVVILALIILGCQIPTPKPKAQLALTYPTPQYNSLLSECTYTFEYNHLLATPKKLSACGITLDYEALNPKRFSVLFSKALSFT